MHHLSAKEICTRSFSFVVLVLLVSTPLFGQEAEADNEAKSAELPDAVEAAFQAAYPNAEILGSDVENQDGQTYYEIESLDGTTKRDLLFLADGTLVETEETIDVQELPAAVRSAADRHGRILKAERITRDGMITFEVAVQGDAHEHELVFDAGGRILDNVD